MIPLVDFKYTVSKPIRYYLFCCPKTFTRQSPRKSLPLSRSTIVSLFTLGQVNVVTPQRLDKRDFNTTVSLVKFCVHFYETYLLDFWRLSKVIQ